MSTINSKNVQVGTSGVAAQNFTLYQPATPDGTVRLGVGNSGATTADVVTVNSAGVTVTGSVAATTFSGSGASLTALNASNLSTGTIVGARLPAGSVLQVVQGTYNTATTSTSTSYVNTGLSAAITPSSASSKVLVLVSQSAFIAGGIQGMVTYLNIVRASTQIWETIDQGVQTYDQGGSGVEVGAYIAMHYLDSPATTSSTTYRTQIKKGGGSESRWRSGTIILMEIAA